MLCERLSHLSPLCFHAGSLPPPLGKDNRQGRLMVEHAARGAYLSRDLEPDTPWTIGRPPCRQGVGASREGPGRTRRVTARLGVQIPNTLALGHKARLGGAWSPRPNIGRQRQK